jgi:CHAT domain
LAGIRDKRESIFTDVGGMKNGEGVQRLRRALVLAGSENRVIGLWPVLGISTKE